MAKIPVLQKLTHMHKYFWQKIINNKNHPLWGYSYIM